MPRLIKDDARTRRFDSDVASLPFPEGGVHGRLRSDSMSPKLPGGRHDAVIADVERTLSLIHAQVDELRRDVDRALRLPLSDTWPPRAA
ncbi:MAG: hypothetical protein SFZ24_10865 [Planctomycetota bacterium]|nr:hypothetical protein [Planctomycetota bacterium]